LEITVGLQPACYIRERQPESQLSLTTRAMLSLQSL